LNKKIIKNEKNWKKFKKMLAKVAGGVIIKTAKELFFSSYLG
jgi:hypothetical protein